MSSFFWKILNDLLRPLNFDENPEIWTKNVLFFSSFIPLFLDGLLEISDFSHFKNFMIVKPKKEEEREHTYFLKLYFLEQFPKFK